MQIVKSGYGGTNIIPIDSELGQKRVIFVEGEITQEKADTFMKQIMHLVLVDCEKPIHVIINSCGGEIDAGLKCVM